MEISGLFLPNGFNFAGCNFYFTDPWDGKLSVYQYTVLDGPGWRPVEHPGAVVLHLSLLEVKVLGLGYVNIVD